MSAKPSEVSDIQKLKFITVFLKDKLDETIKELKDAKNEIKEIKKKLATKWYEFFSNKPLKIFSFIRTFVRPVAIFQTFLTSNVALKMVNKNLSVVVFVKEDKFFRTLFFNLGLILAYKI